MEKYTEVDTFAGLKYFIKRDYFRINGSRKLKSILTTALIEPGFKYCLWLRITRYLWLKHSIFFIISRFILKHFAYKYEFDISYRAKIGPGLAIGHHGYIVVASNAVIGNNCFLRPGVIIGKKDNVSPHSPVIGDSVIFGAGSKAVGNIKIGNHVSIGANAVVLHDVPDNCIAVGVPAVNKPVRKKDE